MVGISTLHVFVAAEGTLTFSEYRPECETSDDDSLHLFGNVICVEGHLLYLARELHVAVSKRDKGLESHSSL